MSRVCVMSTWDVMNDTNINDIVVCRTESQPFESGALPGRSILLKSRAGVHSSCGLRIAMRADEPGCSITATDVLCNARCLEVFSDCDEYMCTERGLHIDDKTDENLYLLQHTFEPPVRSCHLQFVRLAKTDELWMYSIHVTLTDSPPTPCASAGILGQQKVDIGKVKSRLAQVNATIPDKAEQLMKAVETFQQNQFGSDTASSGAAQSMTVMMAMLASMGRPLAAATSTIASRRLDEVLPAHDVASNLLGKNVSTNEDRTGNVDKKTVSGSAKPHTRMKLGQQVLSEMDNAGARSNLDIATQNRVLQAGVSNDLTRNKTGVSVKNDVRVMTTTDGVMSASGTATDFTAKDMQSSSQMVMGRDGMDTAVDLRSAARVIDGHNHAQNTMNKCVSNAPVHDASARNNGLVMTNGTQKNISSAANFPNRTDVGQEFSSFNGTRGDDAALLAALKNMQRHLETCIRESESRIRCAVEQRLRETERRIETKLDTVLQHLGRYTVNRGDTNNTKDVFNTSNNHIELD